MDKVNRRLEQAMNFRLMTAADLSRITGISKSSISRYMSGEYNPNSEKLDKISRALNVNEAWLLGYDGIEMERESDEAREQRSKTIEEDMSDMMLKKLNELYKTLSFQQKVEVFELVRKKELEYEATK